MCICYWVSNYLANLVHSPSYDSIIHNNSGIVILEPTYKVTYERKREKTIPFIHFIMTENKDKTTHVEDAQFINSVCVNFEPGHVKWKGVGKPVASRPMGNLPTPVDKKEPITRC